MDGEPKKNYIIKRMRRFKKNVSPREKNIVIEWVVQNSLIDKKK